VGICLVTDGGACVGVATEAMLGREYFLDVDPSFQQGINKVAGPYVGGRIGEYGHGLAP
jgi:hypothetical protein